jgi:hypothetical protein
MSPLQPIKIPLFAADRPRSAMPLEQLPSDIADSSEQKNIIIVILLHIPRSRYLLPRSSLEPLSTLHYSHSLYPCPHISFPSSFPLPTMPSAESKPRTLYDKVFQDHIVNEQEDGTCLIYIDRHLVHEVTSPQAFEGLTNANRKVRRPDCTLVTVDHVGSIPFLAASHE